MDFFFSVCFLRRSSERILVSPTRRTSLSTLATPTEVTSLGEFQPHFGSHGQEDQKQRNNEGQRIRNNNDLLYKPFPPTSTGLIFIISLLLHSVWSFQKMSHFTHFLSERSELLWQQIFSWQFFFCLREKKIYFFQFFSQKIFPNFFLQFSIFQTKFFFS